jgi:trimeric autotransporter adhesin
MKVFLSAAMLLLVWHSAVKAQVKISSGNTLPHTSAMLDIESTTRGLLIPRMSSSQMNAISEPATGLLVFNTSDSLIYLHLDSGWTKLSTGDNLWHKSSNNAMSNGPALNVGIGTNNPAERLHINGHTKIDGNIYLQNSTPFTGVIYKEGLPFLHNAGLVAQQNIYLGTNAGSFNLLAKKNVAVGSEALANSDGADNTAIGYRAAYSLAGGSSYTESYKNTFIGYLCGEMATGGTNNVAIGNEAGYLLSAGSSGNVLVGSTAGKNITSGSGNVLVGNNIQTTEGVFNSGIGGNSGISFTNGSYNTWAGADAIKSNKLGGYNTALGASAQRDDSSGYFNVYVGAFAGASTQGSNNLFIGPFAGILDTGVVANTLIINNNFSKQHLINGDFGTHRVGINKTLAALNYTLDVGGEIRIGALATAPPGSNGVTYYNTQEDKLKVYEGGNWKNAVYDNLIKTKNTDPDIADVPANTFHVWKNTSTGNVYLWVNDGGVLKKVQLQ